MVQQAMIQGSAAATANAALGERCRGPARNGAGTTRPPGMHSAMDSMSRRQFVQRAGVVGVGLLAGCGSGDRPAKPLPPKLSHESLRSPNDAVPTLTPGS